MPTDAWQLEGAAIGLGDQIANSLADRILTLQTGSTDLMAELLEVERHLHNWESWLGLPLVPNAEVHCADRIGTAVAALQINAGDDTWGSWVCILGSSDTPARVGMTKFDLHRVMVTASQRTQPYFVQIAFGASGAAALAAGTYTEFVYRASSAVVEEAPIDIMVKRQNAGTKAFARCYVPTQNLGTLDFFFGEHEYEV
jgi:hypothetical protein